MSRIIPAILVQTEAEFRKQVSLAAVFAPAIQIDIMDGTFVAEKSFADVSAIAAMHLSMRFGAHLMIDHPEDAVKAWIAAGAADIIVHAEARGNIGLALERIRHADRRAGLAINPGTDLAVVKGWAPFVDIFQVMGVEPGAQGRPFDAEAVSRVRALKSAYPHMTVTVDGGVTEIAHVARHLADAGADDLIVGSALWRAPDTTKEYRRLTKDAND